MVRDNDGRTPLMKVSLRSLPFISCVLITITPQAIESGSIECSRLVIENCPHIEEVDNAGNTVFHALSSGLMLMTTGGSLCCRVWPD